MRTQCEKSGLSAPAPPNERDETETRSDEYQRSRLWCTVQWHAIDRDAIHSDELSVAAAAVDKIESWITDYLTE